MPAPSAFYATKLGALYLGKCEETLPALPALKGKVNLIFTSPPFPLNHKKKYGNKTGEEYVTWLGSIAPLLGDLLAPDGSIVVEIGNAWEKGRPVQSLLPYEALLAFAKAASLMLCQEITYFNPARLPSPAQWVTIKRMRLKDSTSRIWWMARTELPKANNRRVLTPYSKHMLKLLERGGYNSGMRPSEHKISEDGFLKDNGGAIASNLLQMANTESSSDYLAFCREHKNEVAPHPARMPSGIPEFFIRFLTDENDLVLDPFAGSNTTGEMAERLGRRWISVEADPTYATTSLARFDRKEAARRLPSLPPRKKVR